MVLGVVAADSAVKRRPRFPRDRLEGLSDEPQPGALRKITDEQVEWVIARALEEKGLGRDTHWSTRSMASETGMSQTTVSRICGLDRLGQLLAVRQGTSVGRVGRQNVHQHVVVELPVIPEHPQHLRLDCPVP